jgi:hypothetical protein
MEFVVETGAFKNVAKFTQIAAQNRVANIVQINSLFSIISVCMIQDFIVSTTSHQEIIAHAASNIAAIKRALHIVNAFAQTAGHILFAISFAQIFIAIYIAKILAKTMYQFSFHH